MKEYMHFLLACLSCSMSLDAVGCHQCFPHSAVIVQDVRMSCIMSSI